MLSLCYYLFTALWRSTVVKLKTCIVLRLCLSKLQADLGIGQHCYQVNAVPFSRSSPCSVLWFVMFEHPYSAADHLFSRREHSQSLKKKWRPRMSDGSEQKHSWTHEGVKRWTRWMSSSTSTEWPVFATPTHSESPWSHPRRSGIGQRPLFRAQPAAAGPSLVLYGFVEQCLSEELFIDVMDAVRNPDAQAHAHFSARKASLVRKCIGREVELLLPTGWSKSVFLAT